MKEESSASLQKVSRITARGGWRTVIILTLISIFAASFILSVANDVYAFFTASGEITLQLESPIPLDQFSAMLEDNGIISNPHIFALYVRSKNKADIISSFHGTVRLDLLMSYRDILLAIDSSMKNNYS